MSLVTVDLTPSTQQLLLNHTGAATADEAVAKVIAEAVKAMKKAGPKDDDSIVLAEGSKKYRASNALLTAVKGYQRSKAKTISDAEMERITGKGA